MARAFETPQSLEPVNSPIVISAARSTESVSVMRDRFRERFGQITRQTREHRHSAWIQRPEYQSLCHFSNEGLTLSRLIAQALASLGPESASAIQDETIDQLLTANEQLLQVVDSQLQLIQSTVHAAESLQPFIDGMLHADGFPAARLNHILDDLAAQATRQTGEALVPRTGIDLERILAAHDWPSAWFYVSTIQNVRWTALLGPAFADFAPGIQRQLLATTLLADLGRLVGAGRSRNQPAPHRTMEFRLHPSLSAAMIAGLRGGSTEWARLAAQHHERLDGSGFPAGLSGRALAPTARCLTAIVRWGELVQQSCEMDAELDQLVCSAEELWRETRQGKFDSEVVTRLFSRVRDGLLDDVRAERRRRTITLIDPAHALAGPVFSTVESKAHPPVAVTLSRGPHTRR